MATVAVAHVVLVVALAQVEPLTTLEKIPISLAGEVDRNISGSVESEK